MQVALRELGIENPPHAHRTCWVVMIKFQSRFICVFFGNTKACDISYILRFCLGLRRFGIMNTMCSVPQLEAMQAGDSTPCAAVSFSITISNSVDRVLLVFSMLSDHRVKMKVELVIFSEVIKVQLQRTSVSGFGIIVNPCRDTLELGLTLENTLTCAQGSAN